MRKYCLSTSTVALKFCEWVQVVTDVNIPNRKYQVKLHRFSSFSAACAASITHKKHFFRLYQQNKCFVSKAKLRQASNCYKRVLQAAKLPYTNKQRCLSPPGNVALANVGELQKVFSTKVNLLFLLYSTVPKHCFLHFLHLIKQKCFLKSFLKTLILITQLSLYLLSLLELTWIDTVHFWSLKLAKKVIADLDSSKAPYPEGIPEVVLENCELELSHIFSHLFNV